MIEAIGDIELPPLFHGRYNIAPTQQTSIITATAPTKAVECTWGFNSKHSATPIINARSESLQERPMFKHLLKQNRCIIPADGFYEWKDRQPYYFHLPEMPLFGFAGLWQNDRFVIITRAADHTMRGIHDRMPVIVTLDGWGQWLENFKMPAAPPLTARPVSRRVNKVANDDPGCLSPGEVQADLSLFPEEE